MTHKAVRIPILAIIILAGLYPLILLLSSIGEGTESPTRFNTCMACGDKHSDEETATLWFNSYAGLVLCKTCFNNPAKIDRAKLVEESGGYKYSNEIIRLINEALDRR